MENKVSLKSEATKKKLTDAIIRLIQDGNYPNVTVRDICKEAGLSSGAFYHHFNSKTALTREAYAPFDEATTVKYIANFNNTAPFDALYITLTDYIKFISSGHISRALEYYKLLLDEGSDFANIQSTPYARIIESQLIRYDELGFLSSEFTISQFTDFSISFLRGFVFDALIKDFPVDLMERWEVSFKLYIKAISK